MFYLRKFAVIMLVVLMFGWTTAVSAQTPRPTPTNVGGGGDDGGVDVDEAVVVEEVDNGTFDGGANAHDGPLFAGAQPEVPVVHQEIDTMIFGGDGIFFYVLQHFDRLDAEFVATWYAGRTAVFLYSSRHN